MALVDRVKNILLSPRTEWPVIDAEPATVASLYTGYIMPLAAIPALPVMPPDHGHGEFRETWEEFVYIQTPQAMPDVTLVFRFAKWQETDDCRMEALVGGPYLAKVGAPVSVAAD